MTRVERLESTGGSSNRVRKDYWPDTPANNGFNLARRSAGVLAGWPGGFSPPNRQSLHILCEQEAGASLPFGGGDAAEPAGETPAFRPRTPLKSDRLIH